MSFFIILLSVLLFICIIPAFMCGFSNHSNDNEWYCRNISPDIKISISSIGIFLFSGIIFISYINDIFKSFTNKEGIFGLIKNKPTTTIPNSPVSGGRRRR